MAHLTLDEIIDFVSLTEINEESMQKIAAVNTHIVECKECRELVRSFQLVYDELVRTDMAAAAAAAEDVAEAAYHDMFSVAAAPAQRLAAFRTLELKDIDGE